MLNEILHVIEWKKEGRWNKEEVLIDYSIFVTTLFVIASGTLYVML